MMVQLCAIGFYENIIKQCNELSSFANDNNLQAELIMFCNEDINITNLNTSFNIKKITLIKISNPFQQQEIIPLLHEYIKSSCFFTNNAYHNFLAIKLATSLGAANYNNILSLVDKKVTKNIYSSNVKATYAYTNELIVACIATGNINEYPLNNDLEINTINKSTNLNNKQAITNITNTDNLEDARLVVIVGNGCKSEEEVTTITKQYHNYGFKVGATRPIMMNAWVKQNQLIGVSGTNLKADIIITLGVSGAAALVQGLKNARMVIAINNHRDAAIFKYADIGIIADYIEFNKVLENIINKGVSHE